MAESFRFKSKKEMAEILMSGRRLRNKKHGTVIYFDEHAKENPFLSVVDGEVKPITGWWDATNHVESKWEDVEWYHFIPTHGCLCWVRNFGSDLYQPALITKYISHAGRFCAANGMVWNYAKPMTKAETQMYTLDIPVPC